MRRIILIFGMLYLLAVPAAASAWSFSPSTGNVLPEGSVEMENWSCTTVYTSSDTTIQFPNIGDTDSAGSATAWVIGGIAAYDNQQTADSYASIVVVDSGTMVNRSDTIYFGGDVVFQGWTPVEINFGDGGISFPAGDSVAIRISPGAGVTGAVTIRYKQRDF